MHYGTGTGFRHYREPLDRISNLPATPSHRDKLPLAYVLVRAEGLESMRVQEEMYVRRN
jgi:hypothetical protein